MVKHVEMSSFFNVGLTNITLDCYPFPSRFVMLGNPTVPRRVLAGLYIAWKQNSSQRSSFDLSFGYNFHIGHTDDYGYKDQCPRSRLETALLYSKLEGKQ